MQRSIFLTLFLLLTTTFSFSQTTYYISSSSGSDSYTGKSSTNPWKTISKLNSTAFKPGDKILFKKGDIWREQLSVSASGLSLLKIEFSAYGTGNAPIISGANLQTGFVLHSGNIWKKSISSPSQVFFNNIRGAKQSSLSDVNGVNEWYWSANYLYIYSSGNPASTYTAPGIETTSRNYAVYTSGDYLTFSDLQIEKVIKAGVYITSSSLGIVVQNINFYQWSTEINMAQGAVSIFGSYSEVKNCTFGKNTGNDIADQGWAGFVGIYLTGKNNSIANSKFYHTSTENESGNGLFSSAIKITSASGITQVYGNQIYHPGSHGVSLATNSRIGDQIKIYDNTIEYPGQSGISAYKTRGDDGVGGKGYIYGNTVTYANRLGGDVGSNGTQASGIHFNDGFYYDIDAAKPYMKWYCYENVVHNSQALKAMNSPDAGGISMDYNADNVEVYKNLCYNNNGKGIYIWNANKCKIYLNIMYGNDAGTSVSAVPGGLESAANNEIYNNTYYKNYNGPTRGPNIDAEIFFGYNGKNNIIKNNIMYGSNSGRCFVYNITSSSGHVVNNNLLYSENGIVAKDSYNASQTFAQWRTSHPTWDENSVNGNPLFNNAAGGDFSLKSTSPAINKGATLSLVVNLLGTIVGQLDIGAKEYGVSSTPPPPPVETPANKIIVNAFNGTLSGGVKLGNKSGSVNAKILYFTDLTGKATYTVNLPTSGTWYAWGRVYYTSSTTSNSFYLQANNGGRQVLGNDEDSYNKWYWAGYQHKRINFGTLNAGSNTITITAREPGTTLWIDQLVLTMDTNYDPNEDASLSKEAGIEEDVPAQQVLPNSFDISQNYPNPFNPSTVIKYAVPEAANVSLKIYDILGSEIATLVDEVKAPGYYEIQFDGSMLSSGVYIYRFATKDFVQTKKMNLVK